MNEHIQRAEAQARRLLFKLTHQDTDCPGGCCVENDQASIKIIVDDILDTEAACLETCKAHLDYQLEHSLAPTVTFAVWLNEQAAARRVG